jgi:ribosome-associated translation inhibitor RaiA
MTPDLHVIHKRDDPQVERYARERLNVAVGRFKDRLASIEVNLSDNRVSPGEVDKTCSIDARLIPHGMLHVQATERDFHEAIAMAVHRLEAVVAKTIDGGSTPEEHVDRMTDRTFASD